MRAKNTEKTLILTVSSGEDKRQKIRELSSQGITLYETVKRTLDDVIEELMNRIPEIDRKIAEKSLGQLLVNLQKRG